MTTRGREILCVVLLAGLPATSFAAEPTRITSSDPSPLATTANLVERQFSPLDAFQIQARMSANGLQDAFQVDLAAEHLLVRAPDKPAADGRYGLLIYLDARKQARYDFEWNNVLDSHAIVFVSPDNAGDDADTLDRRIPLALHAYEYARRNYTLDPARIYVAGAAGGSRVAQRLALTYPDVFTSAIVNSGAVELGTQVPVPAPDLLRRLHTHSSLVFATSKHDQPAFSEQQRSVTSLRTYCMPRVRVFENGHTVAGHADLSGRFLADFLETLEAPGNPDGQGQAECEAAFHRNATSALAKIRQLEAGGRHDEALKALAIFDRAYGRLFRNDDLALAKQLNPTFFAAPTPASDAMPAESR
jgi:pimeloyl-ACP methyl ester carboxylesterase